MERIAKIMVVCLFATINMPLILLIINISKKDVYISIPYMGILIASNICLLNVTKKKEKTNVHINH